MTKGTEHYKDNIREASFIRLFSASNTAMWDYPYRLGKIGEASSGIAGRSDTYILDSAIGDDNISTENLVERGKNVGADVIVPVDKIDKPVETTKSIDRFLDELETHDYNPTILLPLQSGKSIGYCEHYDMVSDTLVDHGLSPGDHWYGVGGIMDSSVTEQVRACMTVRNHIPEKHIHAFGCGIARDWVVTIRECPSLLDSADNSSITQDVNNGLLFDAEFNRREHHLPRGRNSTCVSTMLKDHLIHMYLMIIGPFARESDVPTEFQSDELAGLVADWQ